MSEKFKNMYVRGPPSENVRHRLPQMSREKKNNNRNRTTQSGYSRSCQNLESPRTPFSLFKNLLHILPLLALEEETPGEVASGIMSRGHASTRHDPCNGSRNHRPGKASCPVRLFDGDALVGWKYVNIPEPKKHMLITLK